MPTTPTALSKKLREATVAQLVAGLSDPGFSQPFTPEGGWLPRFGLEDLADLTVTVVPVKLVTEASTRSADSRLYDVDVCFQQTVEGVVANEKIDPLVALVEEVGDYFRGRAGAGRGPVLATMPEARYVTRVIDPICSWEELHRDGLFASVLVLTFQVVS